MMDEQAREALVSSMEENLETAELIQRLRRERDEARHYSHVRDQMLDDCGNKIIALKRDLDDAREEALEQAMLVGKDIDRQDRLVMEVRALEGRIERLVAAGDALCDVLEGMGSIAAIPLTDAWRKAVES